MHVLLLVNDSILGHPLKPRGRAPVQQFAYIRTNKSALGVAKKVDSNDFHEASSDLIGNTVEVEIGVGFVVACCFAIRKASSLQGLVVLGDTSIQGTTRAVRSVAVTLRLAMDNGAKKVIIPLENKRKPLGC
jgi:ATP-dependent Lon protease